MKVEDCFQLGYVIKTHGLKGEVQFFLDVDNPLMYQNLESVLVEQNEMLIPFFLEYIQINSKKAIGKLEEIDSIDDAVPLVSCRLFLPIASLPQLPDGDYYYHQLVGMDVYEKDKYLGKVNQIYEIAPQNLIALDHQGTEIMIPINDTIIKKVELALGRIETELPEGLLEVYLEDNED